MVTIDIRETLIPFSLLQITNTFRSMRAGDEMEILAGAGPTDTATVEDIMRILPRDGYDLITREEIGEADPVSRLRLKKKQPTTTQQPKGESSCQQSI